MIRTTFLTLLCAVIALVVYLYFYLGVYKPVSVGIATVGPLHLLSKSHVGAYNEIGTTLHEVELWAQSHHVDCPRTFGEFLDDPEHVDSDRLRSNCGCVLTGPLTVPAPAGFTFETRASQDYVSAEFSGSPAIGPFRVYPRLKAFAEVHRFVISPSAIEIYSVSGENVTTQYLLAIKNR